MVPVQIENKISLSGEFLWLPKTEETQDSLLHFVDHFLPLGQSLFKYKHATACLA